MSDQLPYLLILLAAVAVWLVLHWRRAARPASDRRMDALHRRWRELVRCPPAEAEAMLARHVVGLEDRFPGHTAEWYVRRAISNMEWDKRR